MDNFTDHCITDEDGSIIYDSSKYSTPATEREYSKIASSLKFQYWSEPVAGTWDNITIRSSHPIETLSLTRDLSDYSFYSRTVQSSSGSHTLQLQGIADIAHLFIDGRYLNSTTTLLQETRGKFSGTGFNQNITYTTSSGSVNQQTLTIMTCALGLTKLENQIDGDNMVEERKGIWGKVLLDKSDISSASWTIQYGLVGEYLSVFSKPNIVQWKDLNSDNSVPPLTWLRTTFKHSGQEPAIVVDFTGLTKGIAYLNGNCIGRYWNVKAQANMDWGPIQPGNIGKPTQQYYHLPTAWLKEQNELILFEELGGTTQAVSINMIKYNK
jgi:beta-galactosidase